MNLWLAPIPAILRKRAVDALDAGDADGFLALANNLHGLDLVTFNAGALRERGLYEAALLWAYVMTRTNWARYRTLELRRLFDAANPTKLLAAGAPLPGRGPFTVYRGVAGRGPARRIRGFSWSGTKERAHWFAERAVTFGLTEPAVYRAVVKENDVLAYVEELTDRPASLRSDPRGSLQHPLARAFDAARSTSSIRTATAATSRQDEAAQGITPNSNNGPPGELLAGRAVGVRR